MSRIANALSGLAGAGKFTELRSRLLFVLGALIVYRIGVRNVMWSAATFDDKHRLVSDVPRVR